MSAPTSTAAADAGVRRLARIALHERPDEAASLIDAASVDAGLELLLRQNEAGTVGVLAELTPDRAAELVRRAPVETSARWLAALSPNRAAVLFARLDPSDRDRVAAGLEPALADELRALASHGEDTAGHMMDPRVTSFRAHTPVRDVLRRLRTLRSRRVQDVFVVDGDGRLEGVVPLVEIVLSPPGGSLRDIARPPTAVVTSTASRQEVLETLDQSDCASVPVVDFDGLLIGVLRQEELLATARQAAVGSLTTMVGAGRDERALASPTVAVKKRLPWLLVNLGTAFLAAMVVGIFEDTIARFTALAVLLPVVAGQSGNTGAQALAVTMRGLALREVRLRHSARLALKELTAGIVNGAAVAVVTAGAVYLWSGSIGLTLVIGLAMVAAMGIAALSGAMVPMVLTRLGQDPAQSSSIVLTTVTDIMGFLSFLGLANLFASWI